MFSLPSLWSRFASRRPFVFFVPAAVGVFAIAASALPQTGPQMCTLGGAEKKQAIREIGLFLKAHRASVDTSAITIALQQMDAPSSQELDRLIAREKACCSNLTISASTPTQGKATVRIEGPVAEVRRAQRALNLD